MNIDKVSTCRTFLSTLRRHVWILHVAAVWTSYEYPNPTSQILHQLSHGQYLYAGVLIPPSTLCLCIGGWRQMSLMVAAVLIVLRWVS